MKGKISIYAYGNEQKNYLFYTRLDEAQFGSTLPGEIVTTSDMKMIPL